MKAMVSTFTGIALVLAIYLLPTSRNVRAEDGKVCANGKNCCLPTAFCYPEPGVCTNNLGVDVDYDGYSSLTYWVGNCEVGTGSCTQDRQLCCETQYFTKGSTTNCSRNVCALESFTKSTCKNPPPS